MHRMFQGILAVLSLVLMASIPLQAAETQTAVVEKGKQITLDYTLEVDGKIVQSSAQMGAPLTYVQGQEQVIPGLQKQVEGMKVGEQKKVTLQAAEAFGMADPNAVVEVPKTKLPPGDPAVGMMLNATGNEGQTLHGVIKEIKQDSIVVDFNHPLAGKTLTFDVTVKDISAPTA